MTRLVIIPDEKTEALGQSLLSKVSILSGDLNTGNLMELIGETEAAAVMRLVRLGGAQELLCWGLSERGYGVAWTSLEPESEMAGAGSADSGEGLVSAIFASGRSAVQSAPDLQAASWSNIEDRRGRRVAGMAGSPVFVSGNCIAALTLVQYSAEPAAAPLCQDDAGALAANASILGRLWEDRLLRACLGLK